MKSLISSDEEIIIKMLAESLNQFLKLPAFNQWDAQEFRAGVHALQNIVLARPAILNIAEQSNK